MKFILVKILFCVANTVEDEFSAICAASDYFGEIPGLNIKCQDRNERLNGKKRICQISCGNGVTNENLPRLLKVSLNTVGD
jgi:hypothetical protein